MARSAGAVSIPCILDCDPGHDDAIAILLAAAHPAIDLRAITTVGGNGALDKVTYNARRVCTLAGLLDVPIAAGAAQPLGGDELEVAADVHGESALDGPELPEPTVALDARDATALIAATLDAATEPVTLIATGPLTNVAIALDRVDRAAIREVVWMGGSTERGNRTPYAEFNAWADPEAAAAVLGSGVPLTIVGLNLTHQALATDEVTARILALGTPLAETVAGWLTFFGETYRTLFGFPAPPVHDPCAVALVAEPATITTAEAFVAIETEGAWTRGATVVDLDGRFREPPNARVALTLDVPRFWDLVVDAIDRLGG
jgi:purine nucleosidase/pyrimidine-specific ribonucleoside hydrolase